jgi:hypothetical protein
LCDLTKSINYEELFDILRNFSSFSIRLSLFTSVEAAHTAEDGFDNIDHNDGQRMRTENDSKTGDTDDYSIPEQSVLCNK